MQSRIESVSFLEIPNSRRFYHRPYNLSIDTAQLTVLETNVSRALETGNTTIGASTMPSGIIRPTDIAVGDINIPGGWETTRYTFIIKVSAITSIGKCTYYVTGYTGETDVSTSGYIDPDTFLYINSMLQVTENNYLVNINTVLHDHNSENVTFNSPRHSVARVQDVIDNNTYGFPGQADAHVTINAKFALDRGGKLVRAEENIANDYLGKAVNVWISQMMSEMISDYVDTDTAFGDGYVLGRAEDPGWDSAIRILKYKDDGYGLTNKIRYGDLLYMDKTVPSRTTVTEYVPINIQNYINPFDCEDWITTSEETTIASIAAIEIPQLMISSGLISCGIIYSNMGTPNGTGELTITTPITFGGLDNTRHAAILHNRILKEVIPTMTRGNTIPVSFKATVSLVGVSTIEVIVGIASNTPIPYNIPAFGTGTYSPIIMPEQNYFDNFCSNMHELEDVVKGAGSAALNFNNSPDMYGVA